MDVNVASTLLEQIQEQHGWPQAVLADCQDYTTLVHVEGREVRKQITSYVFELNAGNGDVRVDVMDGKIYKPGCGGSSRAAIFISRRVSL